MSTPANLPMGIQSYLDGKSWNMVTGFSNAPDATYRTTLSRDPVSLSLSQGPTSLTTFNRATGTPTLFSGVSLVPRIALGQTLGYSLYDAAGERVQVNYQSQNRVFRQVSRIEEIQGTGVFVL